MLLVHVLKLGLPAYHLMNTTKLLTVLNETELHDLTFNHANNIQGTWDSNLFIIHVKSVPHICYRISHSTLAFSIIKTVPHKFCGISHGTLAYSIIKSDRLRR